MRTLILLLLLDLLASSTLTANVARIKRGFLSRTGVCPEPSRNFQKRDRRLNYFGTAIVVKRGSHKEVTCLESECVEDSHCDADRKCCKNRCGGMVCTRSVRDPDPCENFACPPQQTCKIQRVRCIMPECKDAYALNRPTCIPDSEATVLQNDDDRALTPAPTAPTKTTDAASATASGNYQQYYNAQYQQTNNGQQMPAMNNFVSAPQTSYDAAANQQNAYYYGQEYNWQQNSQQG